jgi:hypothetical protein
MVGAVGGQQLAVDPRLPPVQQGFPAGLLQHVVLVT